MAVVPLLRVHIYGRVASKKHVLEELQELGCLHLLSFVADAGMRQEQVLSARTHEAYEFIRRCPKKRRQVHSSRGFQPNEVEDEALRIKERIRQLNDERDHLLQHIRSLEPWGDFVFTPLKGNEDLRLWFYIVPLYHLNKVQNLDLIWECVYRDTRNAYVVAISRDEPEGMPVQRTHTGDKSLSWLRKRLETVDTELEDLFWRRVGLTRWCDLFSRILQLADDQAVLKQAADGTFDDGRIFVIDGWLPSGELAALEAFCMERTLVLTSEPPAPDDTPPTLLQNAPLLSGGEDLVCFYTTPGYRFWDPSVVVLFSFVVFFAMIVADAGYGLLLGAILLLLRRKLLRLSTGLVALAEYLVAGTVLYGVLAGSYFGLSPLPDTCLGSLQVLDVRDQNQMMNLSIFLGVLHLLLAHIGNLRHADRLLLRLPPVGWIAILLGGVLMWGGQIGTLPAAAFTIGSGTLITGSLLVLCFSSLRPWRDGGWKDRLLRFGDGLLALTGLSKAFGDVLSYLRLFALGLASAQLALTFNGLAGSAAERYSGIGTLFAVLILLVGHALNFVLALLSGVVHGLRLNFIEFFNWGLTEEGYPFRAFRKKGMATWKRS